MKLVGVLSTAVLSLTLGVGVPAYAQQEQHDQQEEKKAQPEKSAKHDEKKAQGEKNNKPEEKNGQEQHAQQGKQEEKAEHAGNHGRRIPDERFRANFGREHRFRVSENDYRRDRRFQYGGYWFGFVQPWPTNWLYTEDVFVVEIDGVYYLCNANYPGVNITLEVTL